MTEDPQIAAKRRRIADLGAILIEACNVLKAQAPVADPIWMNGILNRNGGAGLARDVAQCWILDFG